MYPTQWIHDTLCTERLQNTLRLTQQCFDLGEVDTVFDDNGSFVSFTSTKQRVPLLPLSQTLHQFVRDVSAIEKRQQQYANLSYPSNAGGKSSESGGQKEPNKPTDVKSSQNRHITRKARVKVIHRPKKAVVEVMAKVIRAVSVMQN